MAGGERGTLALVVTGETTETAFTRTGRLTSLLSFCSRRRDGGVSPRDELTILRVIVVIIGAFGIVEPVFDRPVVLVGLRLVTLTQTPRLRFLAVTLAGEPSIEPDASAALGRVKVLVSALGDRNRCP